MYIKLIAFYLSKLWTKVGRHWLGGSREEVDDVKGLQTYRQTDGQTMKTCDQKTLSFQQRGAKTSHRKDC